MCLIELYKVTYSFQILFKLGTKITSCVLFFADFPYERFHPHLGVSYIVYRECRYMGHHILHQLILRLLVQGASDKTRTLLTSRF